MFEKLFKKQNNDIPAIQNQESAWSDDTNIYHWNDFPKYNPDDLIGKKGFGIYRKMMTDEQVKAVVKFKRDAITSRDFSFQFEKDDLEQLSKDEAEFRIRLLNKIIDKYKGSFNDCLNGIMSAIYQGYSLTEKNFQIIEVDTKSWVGLKSLKIKPFDTFKFQIDEFANIMQLIQEVGSKEIKLDINKFIHYVNSPDIDEHYGQSELREAYRSWFSKDVIIKYQNIFLGRYASGFIYAQTQEGYTLEPGSKAFEELKKVLSNVQTTTAMIAPTGVDINVIQPSTTDAYERAIAQNDKAIAKALLVPNLLGITEQGDTGSYSQSQTQLEAFFWTLDADATRLEECLNEQLFNELNRYNFGDGIYPKFKFKPLSNTMKLLIAQQWVNLVSGGAVQASEADEDHLRDMLGMPPRTDDIDPTNTPESTKPEPTDDPEEDETIIGRNRAEIIFTRAERRVDFAAIDRKAETVTLQNGNTIADKIAEGVSRIIEKLEGSEDIKAVAKITLPADINKAIQKDLFFTLKEGWLVGQQHSEIELKKAERKSEEKFSAKINMKSLLGEAKNYFDVQSTVLAGDISAKVTGIIKNAILTGIRLGKPLPEVKEDIYSKLATAGYITQEAVDEYISYELALTKNTPDHAIKSIVRTGTFEAINESRHAYFSDPALNNFVEAYEYSAILDSRTTAICNELGGAETGINHTHSIDWPGWDQYRPPNHWNCRSLLIPITKVDEWEETQAPITSTPQEGFA